MRRFGRLKARPRARSDHPTAHYIWRTQGDGRVKPSHAANDGRVFAWDGPPPAGHPGEDYGCRCWAEPYVPDTQESFTITMQNVSDEGPAWWWWDYVDHYFNGGGQTLTLRETGNLETVVSEYERRVIDDPKGLRGQIADEARGQPDGPFEDDFENNYQMKYRVYLLGKTNIYGVYHGTRRQVNAMLELAGRVDFMLDDSFRDPGDIEEYVLEKIGAVGTVPIELPRATPYRIIDRWSAHFNARVLLDRSISRFRSNKSDR